MLMKLSSFIYDIKGNLYFIYFHDYTDDKNYINTDIQ